MFWWFSCGLQFHGIIIALIQSETSSLSSFSSNFLYFYHFQQQVEILLEAGCDTNIINQGMRNVLHMAVQTVLSDFWKGQDPLQTL